MKTYIVFCGTTQEHFLISAEDDNQVVKAASILSDDDDEECFIVLELPLIKGNASMARFSVTPYHAFSLQAKHLLTIYNDDDAIDLPVMSDAVFLNAKYILYPKDSR